MANTLKKKIEEIVANLNFSGTELVTEDSFAVENIMEWRGRLELLSLGITIDPEQISDYIGFSSLASVMREASYRITTYANNLVSFAEEELENINAEYNEKFNQIISDSADKDIKEAKNAEIRSAIANTRLKELVRAVSQKKILVIKAKSLFVDAKEKAKQISDTWFYTQQQWNVFSNFGIGKDHSEDFDHSYSSLGLNQPTKQPVIPTFIQSAAVPKESLVLPASKVDLDDLLGDIKTDKKETILSVEDVKTVETPKVDINIDREKDTVGTDVPTLINKFVNLDDLFNS